VIWFRRSWRRTAAWWAVLLFASFLAVFVLMAACSPTESSAAPVAPAKSTAGAAGCPQIGAHRGLVTPTTTQDSRLAVAAALADPAVDFVESDVWPTLDGQGVMQHDNNLTVSTTSTGYIGTRTLADIRANVRMDDGSTPQTVTEYLTMVVASGKHAILHYKGHGYAAAIAAAMRATGARDFVRIMVGSPAQVAGFRAVLPGYFYQLGVATGAYAAQAKALGVRVMVIPYAVTVAPDTWIQPYLDAGVPVDYVTYSPAQTVQAGEWPFGRVLTSDVAGTRAALGCPS
jgi:hypothetical protein